MEALPGLQGIPIMNENKRYYQYNICHFRDEQVWQEFCYLLSLE
jgi:hypothetical protein